MAEAKKIMVVDDNAQYLDEFKDMLELSGYETMVFDSGAEALQKVTQLMPDAILLDLKMDIVSGFEVAQALNAYPRTRKIPVVAMTGYYNEASRAKLIRDYGVKCCLEKPIRPLEVIDCLESIFSVRP